MTKVRDVFRTFELGVLTVIDCPTYGCSRVLTIIDCPNIADGKAPIAPVLNRPLLLHHLKDDAPTLKEIK